MKPFLAIRLEECYMNPGTLSTYVISSTCYDAKSEINRLEALVEELKTKLKDQTNK